MEPYSVAHPPSPHLLCHDLGSRLECIRHGEERSQRGYTLYTTCTALLQIPMKIQWIYTVQKYCPRFHFLSIHVRLHTNFFYTNQIIHVTFAISDRASPLLYFQAHSFDFLLFKSLSSSYSLYNLETL